MSIEMRWVLFRSDVRRWRENVVLAVVWMLPRWLVYWCAIRLLAHGTTGIYGTTDPTELNAMEALKRWGKP